jgi:hypothetical protein
VGMQRPYELRRCCLHLVLGEMWDGMGSACGCISSLCSHVQVHEADSVKEEPPMHWAVESLLGKEKAVRNATVCDLACSVCVSKGLCLVKHAYDVLR